MNGRLQQTDAGCRRLRTPARLMVLIPGIGLLNARVNLRILVANPVAQIRWLTALEMILWIALDLGPSRPVFLESCQNFLVVQVRKWTPLTTMRLFEWTPNSQFDKIFHLLPVCPTLSLLCRGRVGVTPILVTRSSLWVAQESVQRQAILVPAVHVRAWFA